MAIWLSESAPTFGRISTYGGVAGTAAAVALSQLGYRVEVIEPGQNDSRRLAGEVFHPPGVAGLAKLNLLAALTEGSIATINGFCVFADGECIRLPYDTVPAHSNAGIAHPSVKFDHALRRRQPIPKV